MRLEVIQKHGLKKNDIEAEDIDPSARQTMSSPECEEVCCAQQYWPRRYQGEQPSNKWVVYTIEMNLEKTALMHMRKTLSDILSLMFQWLVGSLILAKN